MKRVVIVGTSASGKTTLAREVARRLGADHIELDSLFHGPNWQPATTEVFRERVLERMQAERWVVDGNYGGYVRDVAWQRADLIVWLDYPFRIVFGRVLRRTLRRLLTKERLWNDNVESWRMLFSKESIVWWVVTTYRRRKREMPRLLAQFPEEKSLRLRHPRETERWVIGL